MWKKIVKLFEGGLALALLCNPGWGFPASTQSPAEIYPNRLITPDFGIVTVDDLAYDATITLPEPYDPTKDLFARYWQCLPVKGIKSQPMIWRDGKESSCTLEVWIRQRGGIQFYGDRRVHSSDFCREFDENWRKLTRGEPVVCFNGEVPSSEYDEHHVGYRAWVWNKFKTHKGCYSYFGDCDVKGCAQGHCPQR